MSLYSKKSKSIFGFTIIELIVVIALISILSTISFISFQSNLVSSRDATRKADMSDLKMALKSFKQKNGAYPDPANKFNITNSGTVYVYQGILDNTISLNNIGHIPKDPKSESFYIYSTTANKQEFQIGMTIENDLDYTTTYFSIPKALAGENYTAYIDGDYKAVAVNILPSIILAISGTGDVDIGNGSVNRQKFILNKSRLNLPYNLITGKPEANAESFSGVISEESAKITTIDTYGSCADIYNGSKYVGIGSYEIKTDYGKTITNTCDCSSGIMNTTCKNVDNNLIGYWDMETLSGGLLKDLSGNGNNGTLSGITFTGGKIENASNFNGSSDNVKILNNLITGNNKRTVTAWFKTLDADKIILNLGALSTSTTLSPGQSYAIAISDSQFKIYGGTDTYDRTINLDNNFLDNNWHCISVTFVNGISTAYIDGILQGSASSVTLNTSSEGVYIGRWNDENRYFSGSIDEVRIYNRVLSDQEIKDYYDATK